jgi:hypothetical protein
MDKHLIVNPASVMSSFTYLRIRYDNEAFSGCAQLLCSNSTRQGPSLASQHVVGGEQNAGDGRIGIIGEGGQLGELQRGCQHPHGQLYAPSDYVRLG